MDRESSDFSMVIDLFGSSDDDLKDFHNHHLEEARDPLDVKYNMYAMICHSGVMGGGHYVSYSKTGEDKWFCHNDSACKDVPENNIDKSSAYILMYEREGLSLKGETQQFHLPIIYNE